MSRKLPLSRQSPPVSSSGCRSVSRAALENSGNSSRNRIPPVASEISPGFGLLPPPVSAWTDTVWWGARNGRDPDQVALWLRQEMRSHCRSSRSRCSPATSSPGMIVGILLASMVFPAPAGPTTRRLCFPAAATSAARLRSGCPDKFREIHLVAVHGILQIRPCLPAAPPAYRPLSGQAPPGDVSDPGSP